MAKIMLFLTENADGFRVSERTILNRCNISESGYKKARKKLVERHWLIHEPGDYIQVNFNKIFNDYRVYEAGCPQNDSEETEEKASVVAPEVISNPYTVSSGYTAGIIENTEGGVPENTHNSISNTIRDSKKNISNKGLRCEDTPSAVANATASGMSSQPLREKKYTSKEIEKAKNDYYSWYSEKEHKIEQKYNYCRNNEDFLRMMDSEEYQALVTEALARRNALEQEYGTLFPK